MADEIVVADTSPYVFEIKRRKIRTLHIKNLGFPDPIKPYVLSKCRWEWILQLDTGEILTAGLKREIKRITRNKSGYTGAAIRRHEDLQGGNFGEQKTNSWYITRLYRKDSVAVKGNLHEDPGIVRGRVFRITGKDAYIKHYKKSKGSSINYDMVDILERVSYGDLLGSAMVNRIPLAVQYTKLHRLDQELNNFDYLLWKLGLRLWRAWTYGNFIREISGIGTDMKRVKRYKEKYPMGIFYAIDEAKREGLAVYLGLRNEANIKKLDRYKEGGISLLIDLIYREYKRRREVLQ